MTTAPAAGFRPSVAGVACEAGPMSTQDWNRTPGAGEEVDARQVEDAHVRKSEEDANRTNPEVEHDPESERVSEEEVESYKTWEKDEQENPRSY